MTFRQLFKKIKRDDDFLGYISAGLLIAFVPALLTILTLSNPTLLIFAIFLAITILYGAIYFYIKMCKLERLTLKSWLDLHKAVHLGTIVGIMSVPIILLIYYFYVPREQCTTKKS